MNHGEEALTVSSIRKISAGEEVLNYYGPLSNGELLRRYGYVTPKHSRYDVVEIPWSLLLKSAEVTLGLAKEVFTKAVSAASESVPRQRY